MHVALWLVKEAETDEENGIKAKVHESEFYGGAELTAHDAEQNHDGEYKKRVEHIDKVQTALFEVSVQVTKCNENAPVNHNFLDVSAEVVSMTNLQPMVKYDLDEIDQLNGDHGEHKY